MYIVYIKSKLFNKIKIIGNSRPINLIIILENTTINIKFKINTLNINSIIV